MVAPLAAPTALASCVGGPSVSEVGIPRGDRELPGYAHTLLDATPLAASQRAPLPVNSEWAYFGP